MSFNLKSDEVHASTSIVSQDGASKRYNDFCSSGFKLREAPQFQFKKLWLSGSARINALLSRYLRDVGADIVVVSSMVDAEVLLQIDNEELSEVIVGQTPVGLVREKQLRMKVAYRMWWQGKDPEATHQTLDQFRESSYSETLALAKGEEEMLLYDDMRKSIAEQLVWRLAGMQR